MEKILKKISIKHVVGNVKGFLKDKKDEKGNVLVHALEEGQEKAICQVFGVATGYKTGESDNGPWTALLGSFKAINAETGDIFRAGQCFLPDVAMDLVLPELEKDDVDSVDFAFVINIVADESSSVGYFYTASPLLTPSGSDPLAALEARMTKSAPEIEHKSEKKK